MSSIGDIAQDTHRPRFLETAGRWMAANLRYGADLMLPPVCLRCHVPLASHGMLCAACWKGIDFIAPPVCDRLGLPLPFSTGEVSLSTEALRNPPAYARARAAARFEGGMRDLIHGFKYHDRHEAVALFGRMLSAAGANCWPMPMLSFPCRCIGAVCGCGVTIRRRFSPRVSPPRAAFRSI